MITIIQNGVVLRNVTMTFAFLVRLTTVVHYITAWRCIEPDAHPLPVRSHDLIRQQVHRAAKQAELQEGPVDVPDVLEEPSRSGHHCRHHGLVRTGDGLGAKTRPERPREGEAPWT